MSVILLGVLSVFWDGALGKYVALLPLFLLFVFWKKDWVVFPALVLYTHHVFSLNNGVFELLLVSLLFLLNEVKEHFLTPTIPFIIFSSSVIFLSYFNYGITTVIASIPCTFLSYAWREKFEG